MYQQLQQLQLLQQQRAAGQLNNPSVQYMNLLGTQQRLSNPLVFPYLSYGFHSPTQTPAATAATLAPTTLNPASSTASTMGLGSSTPRLNLPGSNYWPSAVLNSLTSLSGVGGGGQHGTEPQPAVTTQATMPHDSAAAGIISNGSMYRTPPPAHQKSPAAPSKPTN